jgi:hypothetical protein
MPRIEAKPFENGNSIRHDLIADFSRKDSICSLEDMCKVSSHLLLALTADPAFVSLPC